MSIFFLCMLLSQFLLCCEALPLEHISETTPSANNEHAESDADYYSGWSEQIDQRLLLTEENIKLLKENCPRLQNATDRKVIQYRIDEDTKKCHWLGSVNKCGKNMFFYFKEEGNIHGICDCTNGYTRSLVYDAGSNSCEPVYSSGSCPTGQYLAVDSKGRAGCVDNPCLEDKHIMFNGSCSRIGDLCQNNSSASSYWPPKLEIIGLEPQCLSLGFGGSSASHVQTLPCTAGSKYSTLRGNCIEEGKTNVQIG